jgi:hypothetical protein
MIRWGNKRANEYWEASVPQDYYIPDENDSVAVVERWIRDKYERARFKGKSEPKWAQDDVDLSLPLATLLAGRGGKDKSSKAAAVKAAAAPVKAPTAAAVASAAPASDPFDLLGFDAFPVASAPAPAPAVARRANDDFLGAFVDMSVKPSGAAAAPQAPAKSADILGMFDATAPAPARQAGAFNPFAGPSAPAGFSVAPGPQNPFSGGGGGMVGAPASAVAFGSGDMGMGGFSAPAAQKQTGLAFDAFSM